MAHITQIRFIQWVHIHIMKVTPSSQKEKLINHPQVQMTWWMGWMLVRVFIAWKFTMLTNPSITIHSIWLGSTSSSSNPLPWPHSPSNLSVAFASIQNLFFGSHSAMNIRYAMGGLILLHQKQCHTMFLWGTNGPMILSSRIATFQPLLSILPSIL